MNIIDNSHYQRAFKAAGFWLSITFIMALIATVFYHPTFTLLLSIPMFCLGIQLGILVQIKHEEYPHET